MGLTVSSSHCNSTVTTCSTSAIADLHQILDSTALDDNQVESVTTITVVMSNVPSSVVLSRPPPPPLAPLPLLLLVNTSVPSMPPPSTPPAIPPSGSTRRRLSSEAVRTRSSEEEAVSNAARPSLTGGVRRSVRALESDGCQEMVVQAARSANHSRGTNGLPMVVQELERRVQNATDSVKQQAAESEEACGAYAEVETYGVNLEASLRVDTAVAAQMEASTAGTSIALAESTAYGENGTRWVDENAVTNNQTRSVLTLRLPSGAYVERCKLLEPRLRPSVTS